MAEFPQAKIKIKKDPGFAPRLFSLLFYDMAVGQHQWDLGVGEFTTHFRTYFSGDWDVHRGYGILTHGHIGIIHVYKINLISRFVHTV